MFKKILFVLALALPLLLAGCGGQRQDTGDIPRDVLNVNDYMEGLPARKTAHLKEYGELLLQPVKTAIERFGDNYVLSWEGVYATLHFPDAQCSVVAYIGEEFVHKEAYKPYVEFEDRNVMEYISYAVIGQVLLDEGFELTDGLTVGMTVNEISKKMRVDGITYHEAGSMLTYGYDNEGNWVEQRYIYGQRNDLDYAVVFTEDTLLRVEIFGYDTYLPNQGDDGRDILQQAIDYVTENQLATFDSGDLIYKGTRYVSSFDSWFDCWKFTAGNYEGYEIGVEETAPHRIYVATSEYGFPILFWQDGQYTNPVLSFLGKWRKHDDNEYIDIKSISREGIVLFDMCVVTDHTTGETALLENLSTPLNYIPATLDEFLWAEYMDEYMDGDVQYFDGIVQTGFYTYAGTKFYLIDSLVFDLKGDVSYIPRSLTGRVSSGGSIHLPGAADYSQTQSHGPMECFGRDDPDTKNFRKNAVPGGGDVINEYFNGIYATEGLQYAKQEYQYLYDYDFPGGSTYHVWESKSADDPHYLYVDSGIGLIIKETERSPLTRHAKEILYMDGTSVGLSTYAYQRFTSTDGKIVVDLPERVITNPDSFVPEIQISDLIMDQEGPNVRFMFFCPVGERYNLNGYILFDFTTWGATLHVTDSSIPDFAIGLYDMDCNTAILEDTEIEVVPEETESQYLDETTVDMGDEERLVIRDYNGATIGYIYVDAEGNKTVKDFYGKILGYYKADRDVTTDYYGKIIARGDVASALFYMDE